MGKLVGKPFQGHTYWIRSVTFMPEGRCIVSGSDDNTIWIWDAEMGKPGGEPFQGHTGGTMSVTFSPDGRCIVFLRNPVSSARLCGGLISTVTMMPQQW